MIGHSEETSDYWRRWRTSIDRACASRCRGDASVTTDHIRTLAFTLEVRIQTAVVSYQFRNLLQERYVMVPGFQMPRQTQFYGVRWDFWN